MLVEKRMYSNEVVLYYLPVCDGYEYNTDEAVCG